MFLKSSNAEELLGTAYCDLSSDEVCIEVCIPVILLELIHFLFAEIIPTILIAIIINNKGTEEN